MAIFEWRKFNFFDLKSNADGGSVSKVLKNAEISCATNGSNQIFLCDSSGNVHIFGRTWGATSFKAHEGCVLLCKFSRQSNLLITVGADDGGSPDLKVWNLSGKPTKEGHPTCLRTMKTALQRPTALGVSDGGQYMAIGFDKGSISLYRGDIARDRSKAMKTLSGGTSAITGIAFKMITKIAQMFVCSDSGVIMYNLHSRDKELKVVLDSDPKPIRCCVLQSGQNGDGHFMVGKDDAVYCYTSDDRASCYALDGEKSILQWFRTNLLAVSKSSKNSMSLQRDSLLTVIDIQNKFIVFSTPIDAVAAIVVEFGTCYVITKSKEVFHLDEKDLQSKLNLLFKKNLYDIAVRIAKSSQYDSEGLAEIFRQYGDHLYSKGDFPGSVEQYTRTIGYLEPSYVIRKFLDSRHITCLTDYLQHLHKVGHATADHTTLLLNCFTRLDQTNNLKDFLSNDANPDLIFDLDVAIKVCRTASVEHALALAKRNRKHDFAISIQTEDMEAFTEALEYISGLSFDDADRSLKKYGYLLMERSPVEMTTLLKKLCTDYTQNKRNGQELIDTNLHIDRGSPEDFIHLFGQDTRHLVEFLEHLVLNVSNCSCLVFNTLIESYLTMWTKDASVEDRIIDILHKYQGSYDRNHIVILCRTYKFWPGVMFIYEEEQLYHLIVRHHLKNRDYNRLLDTCRRLGALQPQLWLQALTGLRSDKTAPSNLLSQILHVIAQEKLQSPLQVLNCLAVGNGPNLASVREYFLQVFQKEEDSFREEDQQVEKYRKDSVALKRHIKSLQEDPIEFRGTICNNCHQPLSIPAIYFLCQHSYHLDCVKGYSENDKDCPACHTKNMQILDSLRAQSESRGNHEAFHNLLDRSPEPFSIVAEYFGRGLFNKIVIVEENSNIETIKPTIGDRGGAINLSNSRVKVAPSPVNSSGSTYGTGAEARMRVQEIQSSKVDIPIAEGRMRAQERQRNRENIYSSSLEANLTWRKDVNSKTPPIGSPRRPATNAISKNLAATNKPKNPFDDDEIEYDESKNPFAEDDDGSLSVGNEASTNPFDDYDSNLNPFE